METKPNIISLVIDDDLEITDLLATMLRTDIHQTIISHDGSDGLLKARLNLPDLILLNVTLPNKDGREVCRELKNNLLTKHIPVIMLTGRHDPETKEQCLAAGANEFMTKPFDVTELSARINTLLNAKPVQNAANTDSPSVKPFK